MGEMAAFGTAIVWAISAMLFTVGGNRVGANVVNLVRLYFGFLFVGVVHWYSTGALFDSTVEFWRHGVLFLSAFVGLVIGDGALFCAFVKIGTRQSMLIMSLVPVFSAVFALLCFDEQLSGVEWAAILISISAIAYVVSENRTDSKNGTVVSRTAFVQGVVFALIGVVGQTGNLIITKYALVDDFSTLTATKLRILYSLAMLTGWALLRGQFFMAIKKMTDRKAFWVIVAGAFFGPFVGIWLSYVAINHTRVAVASVIMATPPLLLIPLAAYFFKERVTVRSVVGTLLALIGIGGLLLAADPYEADDSSMKTTQRAAVDLTSTRTLGHSTMEN